MNAIRLLAMTVALCLGTSAIAQDDAEDPGIAPQPLNTALEEFADRSGLQIIYVAELAEGKDTSGAKANLSNPQILDQLLANTGLEYEFLNANTVTVRPAADEGSSDSGNSRTTPILMAQNQASVEQNQASRRAETDSDEDEKKQPLEEIVVTGTNIRGIAPDSSPSFIFDREDIHKSGFGTVSEFIRSLPQNFGGGANITTSQGLPNDRSAINNGTSGSSVNLRGLGSGATLVLLNGSRLAPAGLIGDFVDISTIPLSAVERVEVLTDGASAIYGADAISGVVNFVLRDDYDGAESFVRFGSVTEGDLNEYRAGQTFGKSWDSGNGLVSYEFYDRDNLGAEDRDFSSADLPYDLLPEQESHNVLLTGSQQLGDRITLRGHGTYSRREGSFFYTLGTGSGSIPASQPSKTDQHGGAVGAKVKLWGDWQLDVSGGYSKLNEDVDVVIPALSVMRDVQVESDLWSVDGKADGTVFRLPGGDVKVAAGSSYREENFHTTVSADVGADYSRSVFSAFGEAFIPIVGDDNRQSGMERLELTLAGRYDDYNDFGSTFNPKVGVLWSPADGLNFRGSYNTSFNAPNLGDIGEQRGSVQVLGVPNPASPTGVSPVIYDGRPNPDLGPEESTSWTAGVDYQHEVGPGELDVALTWFDISYTDRIELAGDAFEYLNDPLVFADVIIVDPDPALTASIIDDAPQFFDFSDFFGVTWTVPGDEDFILDNRLLNLAKVDASGLDFNISYNVDAAIGQLTFGLNSSYLLKQERQITANSPVFDVVDSVFNPVDLRLRGNVSWNRDGLTASAFVNYVDSYVDDRNLLGMGDVPIESWTTVDFSLIYDTGEGSEDRLLDNTKFSLSVLNLFDQDPPTIAGSGFTPNGFDPTNADPLCRFISFQIAKAW